MIPRHTIAILSLIAALAGLSACTRGVEPTSGAGVVYLSALEPDTYSPTVLADLGPPITAKEREIIEQAHVTPFLKNPRAYFDAPRAGDRLERVETAFTATGRLLELVAVYREEVKARGMDSPAAPRLAWWLIRLGQEGQARAQVEAYAKAKPEDGTAWFLLGALWMRGLNTDAKAAALVLLSWERALELDPKLRGFERFGADAVRSQLAMLRQRAPITPEQRALLQRELIASLQRATDETPKPDATPPPDATPKPQPDQEDGATTAQAPGAKLADAKPADVKPAEQPGPGATGAKPAPTDGAKPAARTYSPDRNARIFIARAQLASAEGDAMGAARHTREALAMVGGDLVKAAKTNDPDVAFRLVQLTRATATTEADKTRATAAFRALAARQGVSASLRYELAVFALRQLDDRAAARALLQRVKADDPERARALGVDALLSQAQ